MVELSFVTVDQTSLHYFLNKIIQIILPPICILCRGRGGEILDLCPDCQQDLPWTATVCPRCGLPISISLIAPQPLICGRCQRFPPSYDRMFAAFIYEAPVSQMIIALKFNGYLAYAYLLGELLAQHLATMRKDPLPEIILPVPLHKTRLRTRGYNQALELARPIAKRLGVPMAPQLCQRTRATAVQSSLDAKQRQSNVRGAFAITDRAQIIGRRVAILDDVVTTGNTVEEVARVVRDAGAQEIEIWTVARTLSTMSLLP